MLKTQKLIFLFEDIKFDRCEIVRGQYNYEEQ